MKTSKKHIIGFLIIHLITWSIYNLGHPVTPQFIKDLNAPVYMTGFLMGTMALAQFIFAPLWGQISDKYGRKVAFIGPLGYAVGQLGFVVFNDAPLLLISRFLSGAFAVITSTVHFAYVSDKSALEDKTKYLGISSLLLPIGVFIGYTIGGSIGDYFSPRSSFLIQSLASLTIAIIMYFYVESPRQENARFSDIKWNIMKENKALLIRNNDTCLKYILLITFMNIISFQLTISQATVIVNNGFNQTLSYVGIFVATFNLIAGLLSFVVQPFIFKTKKSNVSFLPLLSLGSTLAALIAYLGCFTNLYLMWFGLMLATILNTSFIALIQDVIMRSDKHNEKGALIGINQAVQSLGIFVGTILAGLILSKQMYLPLLVGALIFVITFIINQFVVKKNIEKSLLDD